MNNAAPPTPGPAGPDAGEQPSGAPQPGPGFDSDQFRHLGQLRRSRTNRRLAGVAGGLARHFDIDPVIVRVALVVLALFGGAGLLFYLVVWILVPEEGTGSRPLGLDDRSRGVGLGLGAVVAALVLVSVVTGAGDGMWWLWPIAIVTAIVLLVSNRGTTAPGPRYGEPPYGPQPQGPQPYGEGAPYGAQPPHGATWTSPGPYADPAPQRPGQAPAPGTPEYAARYGSQPPAFGPPSGGWTAPPPAPAYVRPPNPRRRGPILFGITLALIATGIGILGIVDVSGVAVANSAYPALALAVTTVMLLLGAFWGRAGGLIALGLVASLVLGATTVGERVEQEDVLVRPAHSSQVADRYDMHVGRMVVDLSGVVDPAGLDGHDLRVDGGIGDITVIVPGEVDAEVTTNVGIGGSEVFGHTTEGLDVGNTYGSDQGAAVADMTIHVELGIGDVTVEQQ